MSKKIRILLIICACVSVLIVLNLPVTSRQGVNFVVRSIKMPLYIKIIEFLDRDYHYQELVRGLCQGCQSDEERALALFEWTYQNIKTDIPKGWPIIDDHVWHIIVRGYGIPDQLSDVFTTLCNYAGLDAFYKIIQTADRKKGIIFSLVKIEQRWIVFDPYRGVYFKGQDGKLIDVEGIRSGNSWFIESLGEKPDKNYAIYLDNLPPIKDIGLGRSSIQSPLNRLIFAIKQKIQK